MEKEKRKNEDLVFDAASLKMLEKADKESIDTCFARYETQKFQCKFGTTGVCCKICHMGPCRITAKAPKGICGADVDTIVARNYLREVVAGTAAHSDHGRHLVLRLKRVAQGNDGGYQIKDVKALHRAANDYNIPVENKTDNEIALDLANLFLGEYTSQEENLKTLKLAPIPQQNSWKTNTVEPKGIDRSVVESMHRTNMGVDHNYKNLLKNAFSTSLADGWGGSRIAMIVSDILFGTPSPVRSAANLGILSTDKPNILVHGHEPELSEMLAIATNDPEIIKYAKAAGVEGVQLSGICCTANEILMRHGIPVAGSFLQQELAIITGAVEMMIIDVQCCMPSLPDVAKAYHTEIVSTSDIAMTEGAVHMPFDEDNALGSAKTLLKKAIDNYKNRVAEKVSVPDNSSPLIAGFSVDAIKYMLGGRFRASFRPLNDAIIAGRIKGLVGIVGCTNPKGKVDSYINTLTAELLKQNILILKTGCAAIASGKEGRLTPEAALKGVGKGLREVCEAVGIPPVLHMGSCVDNARILEAATEVVNEGGLGDSIATLPAVGVAPEWMSEKAVAIGCYFVASGVDVVLGQPFHISGSENVTNFLNNETNDLFGGSFHYEPDAMEASKKIITIIDEARDNLGINKKVERKLYDMKDRRAHNV